MSARMLWTSFFRGVGGKGVLCVICGGKSQLRVRDRGFLGRYIEALRFPGFVYCTVLYLGTAEYS